MSKASSQVNFYKRVGELVHQARKRRGLSQEALASGARLKRSSISNVESGRQQILVHTLVEISEVLGVEPETLLPPKPRAEMRIPDAELQKHSKPVQAFIEKSIAGRMKEKGIKK